MGRRARPRTDFGTVILHWTLVGLLTISVVTGLRIATASPVDFGWLWALDSLLPQAVVWTAHIPAAVGLFGLALAYAFYVGQAGLTRRIRLDEVRLMGLLGRSQVRWGAINIGIIWILILALSAQLVTGGLMYLGYGGAVVELHRLGTWILLAGAAAHVAAQWAMGGLGQLGRIWRPSRLPPPAPPFDLFDLITAAERTAETRASPNPGKEGAPRHRQTGHASRRRSHHATTIQAHPFAVAMAAGLVGMAMLTVTERTALRDTLHIRKIPKNEAPVLDGDPSDAAWRSAERLIVPTNQGANFDGTGTSAIEIRAVHDGETVYFSFVWDDPTRSLKHLPLVKKADGWHVLQSRYDIGDENDYHEDKFSVLLTRKDLLIAGDRTFHAGRAPADGKPATLSGRGLHFTTDGGIVDVWQWKATRGGLSGWFDDGHFGPPAEPSPAETAGRSPYKGGFASDPGNANHADNFEQRAPGGYQRPVQPKRLPQNWHATWTAMGRISLDPNVGESDGARWWMTEAETLPYSRELDARFPVGAVIPGVINSGDYTGDRADIRCAARWHAGRWALEVARRLDTKSPYDVAIASGVFMRVAAFDRSQIRHTRHIRPIRLEVH